MLEDSVECRYLTEAEWRLEEKDLCQILNIKLTGIYDKYTQTFCM